MVSGGLFRVVCIRCDAHRPLHPSQSGSATSDDTTRPGASGEERKAKRRKTKGIKINLRAVCLVRAIFDDEVDEVVDESGGRRGRRMDG